jgi:GT2 family glycosyltransferase
VKVNGWDESFKVGEHEDFFYRAKLNGLKVALVEDLSAHHYPGAKKEYRAFRERSFELKKNFPKKFFFDEYREINTDNDTIIFSYSYGKETGNPAN